MILGRKYISLLLAGMLFTVFSCTKSNDLLTMVPDDSALVIKINTPKVLDKACISSDNGQIAVPEDFAMPLQVEVKGIDADAASYLFADASLEKTYCLFGLSDAEAFAQSLAEASFVEASIGDVKVYELDGKVFGICGDKCIAGTDGNAVAELFEAGTKQKSVSKELSESLSGNDDMTVYTEGKVADRLLRNVSGARYGSMIGGIVSGNGYVVTHVNFEKESVVADVDLSHAESEPLRMLESVLEPMHGGKALSMLPDGCTVSFGIGLNGEKLLKLPIMSVLSMARMGNEGIKQKMNDALATIKGDVAVGLVYDEYSMMPKFTAVIESDDVPQLEELMAQLCKSSGISCEKRDGKYKVSRVMPGVELSFGERNGCFVVSSIPDVKPSETKPDFKGNILALHATTGESGSAVSYELGRVVGTDISGSIDFSIKDSKSMQFKVSIADPESDNSLKSILKTISSVYVAAQYRNDGEDVDNETSGMIAIDELQDID
ncbi:MAG: DUF4836 family protein [Muribaculaceae bacterium]